MAITLETIAKIGVTPIQTQSASAKAFANNYAKLASPGISAQDRKTITILGMLYVLALSGVDYKLNHAGLIQDAAVYTGGISNLDIFAALPATTAGAMPALDPTFSLDVEVLLKEGRDFQQLPEQTLDRIIAFLAAQIGI